MANTDHMMWANQVLRARLARFDDINGDVTSKIPFHSSLHQNFLVTGLLQYTKARSVKKEENGGSIILCGSVSGPHLKTALEGPQPSVIPLWHGCRHQSF